MFTVALLATALGAGGYAFYQSSSAPKNPPAQIVDGRKPEQVTQSTLFPPFTIHAGNLDSDGLPTSDARLCVEGETLCYSLAANRSRSQNGPFFGLAPKAERVTIQSGDSVVFFSGISSAGGSGFLESFVLLRYDKLGKISNLLPPIQIADGGDRHVWMLSGVSQMPIVAFAQANWGEGEAHYGDRHFYTVSAYVFDSSAQKYKKGTQYITSEKYYDGEGEKPVMVLTTEKPTILAKLMGTEPPQTEAGPAPTEPIERSIPAAEAPTATNPTTKPDEAGATRRLAECILPKAQYGRYSSYDGGQSVINLMEACPFESGAFSNQCEASGHSSKECSDRLAVMLQGAIRKFGK